MPYKDFIIITFNITNINLRSCGRFWIKLSRS